MPDTTAPRYSTDLTPADVDGLVEFVERQLDTSEARYSTTEGKAVSAVRTALSVLSAHLLAELPHVGTDIRSAHAVRSLWGHLVSLAYPWHETPGYDTARWVHIVHPTPDAERIDVEIRARLDAEDAATDEAAR